MTRLELFEQAAELGVKIIQAQSKKDNMRVAIHLLNPTLCEMEDALCVAERDMFLAIVVHTEKTFPKYSK